MVMKVQIALTQSDPISLNRLVEEISNPSSTRYRKHLSRLELRSATEPIEKSAETVIDWLTLHRVARHSVDHRGDWIKFSVLVGDLERLLGTSFDTYQWHDDSSKQIIRARQYSVPAYIKPLVTMIQPITRFGEMRPMFSSIHSVRPLEKTIGTSRLVEATDQAANICAEHITPACLKELYHIGSGLGTLDPVGSGVLAVTGFLDQHAQVDDLTTFLRTHRPDAPNESFGFISINGASNLQFSDVSPGTPLDVTEANLDMQYTVALTAPLIPNVFMSTAGRGPLIPDLDQPGDKEVMNEPWLDFLTWLRDLPDDRLPHTVSTSYGENEQSLPAEYVVACCSLLSQIGARGVSLIFASGDTGVGSACQANDGSGATRFNPVFPASCPWVTSVGGVLGIAPERAVGFSSGGFSDVFARPPYQDAAIHRFLTDNNAEINRWKGLFDQRGRGFPDVSAQSVDFVVTINGTDALVSGTSASTPVFAAGIALINGHRVMRGDPPLGFLNPWLYLSPDARAGLDDVQDGASTGCSGRSIYSGAKTPQVDGASWAAVAGWDPVTGLGTPNFARLASAAGVVVERSGYDRR